MSSFATNEAIPLFSDRTGHWARGEAVVILPDDSLITQGQYAFHHIQHGGGGDAGMNVGPALPAGWGRITIPNHDFDTFEPLPGFVAFELNFPEQAMAWGVNFRFLEDGTIQGALVVDGWNDESLTFNPDRDHGWFAAAFFDGMNKHTAEQMPGPWVLSPYEVPEPGTLLLLSGALAGLALSRRCKQP